MRGRKPELKVVNGGLASAPKPPEWLPKSALAEWRRIMPDLIRRRVLVEAELTTVEHYCWTVAVVRECHALIKKRGATVDGKRNPAFQTLFQALSESRRLAAELGLTPASRSKVGTDETEDDELGEMVR